MISRKSDYVRIESILEAIYEIEGYVRHAKHEDFLNNSMMRTATVKQLEIIGSIAASISSRLREAYPQVQWDGLSRMHTMLVHEYLGINFELVWLTATKEVPVLKRQFEIIKANAV